MLERTITAHLLKLAEFFPVVTIMGPRQSGKTTLARTYFPNYAYVNLENPEMRELAQRDPQEFMRTHAPPVIIDEVQRVPMLLSYIQVYVDEHKGNGQFILTGSHQPELRAEVSQSLAGRTAIMNLLPFSISELAAAGIVMDRDEYIFKGFMPRIYDENVPPELLYSNYFMTYVERDVHQLINVANKNAFETFIKLLAGRVGQVVNLQSMSGEVGVSAPTLAAWLSVLESSFIVFRLPCFFRNFGKRLTKSPKVYFTDVGLAAYLLGIKNPDQVARDPVFGGLFENLVVLEVLKSRYNQGQESELYYFRDTKGLEIDLLLNRGQQLYPFEIKAARTFDPSFVKGLKKFMTLADGATSPTIVYAGDMNPVIHGVAFANFKDIGAIINKDSN